MMNSFSIGMRMQVKLSCLTFLGVSFLVGNVAQAAPVSLTTWTAESYPAVSGFGAGNWTVAGDGDSVFQSVNGQPTLFYSDFNAINSEVTGVLSIGGGDDDLAGFALGFNPGDSTNAAADYLLIDWKGGTQDFNFGAPSNTPGSTSEAGLAVSRVTGIPTADEFWGHVDFDENPGGGLTELARANTLGETGWTANTDYEFRFIFQSNRLQVFVDDTLEFDIAGSFSDGRLAFYNFSQAGVTYSAFDSEEVPPPIPVPAAVWLFGSALGLLGWRARSRTR